VLDPVELRRKVNLYRRYPYWRDAGCVFIHVPKAAGTSVNHALYGRPLGHYTVTEVQRAFPRLWERAFTFTVVRNPFDRVLSAYRFARAGRTESMGIRDAERYQQAAFSTFPRFVLEWLVAQDLSAVDPVFRTQTSYLDPGADHCGVDLVARVESLEADIRVVASRLGRNLDVPALNVTGRARDRDTALNDPAVRRAISDAYATDFQVLDYPSG